MHEALQERRAERERLIRLAREYVERLQRRLDLRAAGVAGSVARGDFNVWSDVDVVVIAEGLPERIPDRGALLVQDALPGIQPIGYTPAEFERALDKGDRLACELVERGLVLSGEELLARYSSSSRRS